MTWRHSDARRTTVIATLAALATTAAAPGVARAQAIGGIVRDAAGHPLARVDVSIPSDLGRPLAAQLTQPDGTFLLVLPRPGVYRLRFAAAVNAVLVGDTIRVEGDSLVQREFRLALPAEPVYYEYQVERPATPAPGNTGPRYPEDLKKAHIQGSVLAQFVVDSLGRVRPGTFELVRASHVGFVTPVREALERMRFIPAERDGHRVATLVRQPFTFQLEF